MLKNYQWRTLLLDSARAWPSTNRCSSSCCISRATAVVYWKAVGGLLAPAAEPAARPRADEPHPHACPTARCCKSDALVVRGDLSRNPLVRFGKNSYEALPARLLAPPHEHGARRMNPRVVMLTTYFRPIVGGVESNAERLARFLHAERLRRSRGDQTHRRRRCADTEDLDGVPIERIGPLGERSASGKWRMLPPSFRWLVRHARPPTTSSAAWTIAASASPRSRRAALTGRPVVLQAQTPGGLDPEPRSNGR